MNRLPNNRKENPYLELKLYLKKNTEGKYRIDSQLFHRFRTPQELKQYIKEEKAEKKKIKHYDLELTILESKIYKSKENFTTRSLWKQLINIIVRMYDRENRRYHLYGYFEDRIYDIAKRIIYRE